MPAGAKYTEEDLGKALSDYVEVFDKAMKRYLAGMLTDRDLEMMYLSHFRNNKYLI